jgi:hypothetical protein
MIIYSIISHRRRQQRLPELGCAAAHAEVVALGGDVRHGGAAAAAATSYWPAVHALP